MVCSKNTERNNNKNNDNYKNWSKFDLHASDWLCTEGFKSQNLRNNNNNNNKDSQLLIGRHLGIFVREQHLIGRNVWHW